MPLPLEDFESRYEMLKEEMKNADSKHNYSAKNIIFGSYEPFVTIHSRLRNRVGSFVRSVESNLSERQSAVVAVAGTVEGLPVTRAGVVFIGHGHSRVWKDLRDLLTDRLNLSYEEFNREPVAGKTTKERLEEMLDRAAFAFLIMTAEEEHSDSTVHARENVIHEVGLFQGRLGFTRAIVLMEEGCEGFSNIHGLTQIRFPRDNVIASAEEIRRVLEREGIIETLS